MAIRVFGVRRIAVVPVRQRTGSSGRLARVPSLHRSRGRRRGKTSSRVIGRRCPNR
jgi:hypothetical protein